MVRAVDQEAVDRAMGGASVRPERKNGAIDGASNGLGITRIVR